MGYLSWVRVCCRRRRLRLATAARAGLSRSRPAGLVLLRWACACGIWKDPSVPRGPRGLFSVLVVATMMLTSSHLTSRRLESFARIGWDRIGSLNSTNALCSRRRITASRIACYPCRHPCFFTSAPPHLKPRHHHSGVCFARSAANHLYPTLITNHLPYRPSLPPFAPRRPLSCWCCFHPGLWVPRTRRVPDCPGVQRGRACR